MSPRSPLKKDCAWGYRLPYPSFKNLAVYYAKTSGESSQYVTWVYRLDDSTQVKRRFSCAGVLDNPLRFLYFVRQQIFNCQHIAYSACGLRIDRPIFKLAIAWLPGDCLANYIQQILFSMKTSHPWIYGCRESRRINYDLNFSSLLNLWVWVQLLKLHLDQRSKLNFSFNAYTAHRFYLADLNCI